MRNRESEKMREDKEVLISDSNPEDELDCELAIKEDGSNCDKNQKYKKSNKSQINTGSNKRSGQYNNVENQPQNSGAGGTNQIPKIPLSNLEMRIKSFFFVRIPTAGKSLAELWRIHWRLLLSGFLTIASSSGCLIFFPRHLEDVTDGIADGYSACLAAATISTALFLFSSSILKLFYWKRMIFKPSLSALNIFKIGFSVGLSILTLFYSWEDKKVKCNLQDPLLGLVVIFAIITHCINKWNRLGFKRSFALATIAVGVFVSVDYPLVDYHRCRGFYYPHPPPDPWTWKVHLVWTLAFVVSIWLWTVSMFCLETAIPLPKKRQNSRVYYEQYNAVKMTVIRITDNTNTTQTESVPEDPIGPEPDLFQNQRIISRYGANPYTRVPFLNVANAVLWFQITSWLFIASLFWTEFVPGFGKGTTVGNLPSVLIAGFVNSLTGPSSWFLILSIFVFSQAFTYLILLIRSPMIAISLAVLGFPIVGVWWSVFQMRTHILVWMPVFTGELICALLGFPLILVGIYFLFKLDILSAGEGNVNQV